MPRPLSVKVYDTGDLDDEDEPEVPIGPGYWSQNMQGSPIPDVWSAWRDDFFVPASRLMKTAPWLFVRGNHELCSRAGPGWFYLLDPASSLLGRPPAGVLPTTNARRLAARRLAQAAGPAVPAASRFPSACLRPCD